MEHHGGVGSFPDIRDLTPDDELLKGQVYIMACIRRALLVLWVRAIHGP